MKAAGWRRGAQDWGVAALAGGLAVSAAAAWLAFGVRAGPDGPPWRPASSGLQLHWDTGAQEARLMDPSALFLPGEETAAAPVEPRATATVAFLRLAEWSPPELAFRTQDLQIPLPPPVSPPHSAAEALGAHPPGNPAAGFGRGERSVAALDPRPGRLEITDLRTGGRVYTAALPPALGFGPGAAPETYYLVVSAVGPVGSFAAQTAPAGRAQKLLDAALGPAHRLAPGSYRISIGP